jgi:ABC-2 type transport system permease protein
MGELRLELRAMLAVARKELRHLSRYRLDLAASLFVPIVQFLLPTLLLGATFLVAGRAAGFLRTTGTADVTGYFVLGATVSALTFVAFWGAGFAFRREMLNGTLEPLWLVPTRLHSIVVGYALANALVAVVSASALFAVGALFFGSLPVRALLGLLPLALLLELAMLGVTYLMAAVVLVAREPNVLIDVGSYVFQALSGVMFPVTVLPAAVGAVSLLLPTTYALDILRAVGLGTRPLLPVPVELAALFALAGLLLPLGAWTFGRAERRLRRLGTLGSY